MSTASDLNSYREQARSADIAVPIAHDEPLKAERAAILAEPVSKAILVGSGDWIEAGKLKAAVQKKAKVSLPTVERRIAGLVERGLITRKGSGGKVSYRTTGLIDP